MKKLYKSALTVGLICLSMQACKKDALNLKPTNDVTSESAYKTPANYKSELAKLYAGYALTSPQGADGSDVGGLNSGFTDFLRLFWTTQVMTTDEAVCSWNDTGIPELDNDAWSTDNVFLRGLYSRSLLQITFVNEYLRESTPEKLAARGITGADATDVQKYRAEARFLRAFQYWVLMDEFGNPPFVTEADAIGKTNPKQTNRAELFNYVESELKAIEPDLADPKTNEYGRADKAADWALLARVYLNAQVYTGTAKYTEAVTYSKKVIDAGYSLKTNYADLFNTSNTEGNNETILTINYDGINGTNNGGTTFLINAAVSADMKPATFGIPTGGWAGIRTRDNLPALFPDVTGAKDKRAMFTGTKATVDNIAAFTDGLAVTKFKNVNAQGVQAPSINGTFASLDFPLFRLAEQYLIYGEAVMRGGAGGTQAEAIAYVNKLRERAYGNTSGDVTSVNVDFFLDERARELYWECQRRTDLVRYGKFTSGSYLWPFKGGTKSGKALADTRNIYPIPAADLIANPNLVQNPGY
jgi:hypothetical protein